MRRKAEEKREEHPVLRQWGLNANVAMVTAVLFVFLCIAFYLSNISSYKLTVADGGAIAEFDLRAIAEQISVPKNASIYPVEITRTAKTSYSLIFFKTKAHEPYHWHAKHNFLLKVLAGRAGFLFLDRHLKLKPEDTVAVSAGTKYAIENLSKSKILLLLAISSPPYDGKDLILSEEK
jgi:mannose-6-phosphate isomerase-like protein (cupin superfamily)